MYSSGYFGNDTQNTLCDGKLDILGISSVYPGMILGYSNPQVGYPKNYNEPTRSF